LRGLESESEIIAKARARERRYLASIKNHPGSPRRFDDLLLYLEDNLIDLRELTGQRRSRKVNYTTGNGISVKGDAHKRDQRVG
jgi:hypothetical protein